MTLNEGQLVKHRIPDRAAIYGIGIVLSYNRHTGLYKVYWSVSESAVHHVRESLNKL
jgi:hypothetical protein